MTDQANEMKVVGRLRVEREALENLLNRADSCSDLFGWVKSLRGMFGNLRSVGG